MQIVEKKLTSNKVWTHDFVREVSIYLMTRPFYVRCNSSAGLQFIKLRNFFPKASAKIGVTMFIKSHSSNDCKSMVCVQYDNPVVLIYVKAKIVHYKFCCIGRGALQKMVGLLKKIW